MRYAVLAILSLSFTAAPAVAQDYISFVTPSGNIHCMIAMGDEGWARCDISEFTPSFTRPGWCEQDFGFAFNVDVAGPGYPLCAGDTVIDPRAQVLPYGQSAGFGGITCTSAETGVTCTNATGGGFTVARAGQRVF